MFSFITQHKATDVVSFEGVCNWHADCRNLHQSCCPWIECSFLYHKPSPKVFQRIWKYIQPASQPQTTCNHTSPGPPHPASLPPRKSLWSLSSAHEKWGQKQKCYVYNFVQCVYICVIYNNRNNAAGTLIMRDVMSSCALSSENVYFFKPITWTIKTMWLMILNTIIFSIEEQILKDNSLTFKDRPTVS